MSNLFLTVLKLADLRVKLRCDIPYKAECDVGADQENGGNQNAQSLDADDGCRSLSSRTCPIADPAKSQNCRGVSDGLTDTSGEVECSVD